MSVSQTAKIFMLSSLWSIQRNCVGKKIENNPASCRTVGGNGLLIRSGGIGQAGSS